MTLKDIANEAGVSIMTVSNVINGNNKRVSKKTIEKVNSIIKKYNYTPNMSGRILSTNKSNIIVVLFHTSNTEVNIFNDPYIQEMIGDFEVNLRKKGYYLMLRAFHTLADVTTLLRKWNVDGAIMFYPYLSKVDMQEIVDTNVPILVIDRYYKDLDVLTVDVADFEGGYLATKFLIMNGHKNIIFTGPDTDNPELVVKNRLQGYKEALQDSNIPYDPSLTIKIDCDDVFTSGKELAKFIRHSNKGVTAVISTLYKNAMGLSEGLRLNGYSVPSDISIVTFDDLPAIAYYLPKLTTISQHLPKKAELIVNQLIHKIEGKEVQQHMTVDVEIIDYNSVRSLK